MWNESIDSRYDADALVKYGFVNVLTILILERI